MRKIRIQSKIIGLILLGSIILTYFSSPLDQGNSTNEVILEDRAADDLICDFTVNQSTIGKQGGILATLNITYTGEGSAANIQTNFSMTGEYANFTDSYPTTQEITSLSPGGSAQLNIELGVNSTGGDTGVYGAVDLVILFDASGSMGPEISDVKSKFLEITANMKQEIASLRIGLIVYGWSKYSEYPTESPNNYIELTEDIDAVNTLIQELTASGSLEPWGDAYYLANTWNWRDFAQKLIIQVGDEDCDAGLVVGDGAGDSYNGSQLLAQITNLKNKGVKINTVLTGSSGEVVDQFNWIANYTEGECVDLDELQSSENPATLSELIESWTLELAREFAIKLTADISWTEYEIEGTDYETQESLLLWVDLAGPSIDFTKIVEEESDGSFSLLLYSTPFDLSGIAYSHLYFTRDNIIIEPEPTWHFMTMTLQADNKTFYGEIPNLTFNQHMSFYIRSTDKVGNAHETAIQNVTITIEFQSPGIINEFLFTEDNSTKSFCYYSPGQIGYLWIKTEENLSISIDPIDLALEVTESSNEAGFFIYRLNHPFSSAYNFSVILTGNTSASAIILHWVTQQEVSLGDCSGFLDTFTSRTLLYRATLNSGLVNASLSSTVLHNSELIHTIYVFDTNWNLVGNFTVITPLKINPGEFYLWVVQTSRSGSFTIIYSEEAFSNTDSYYDINENDGGAAAGFIWLDIIFAFILSAFVYRKIRSNYNRK